MLHIIATIITSLMDLLRIFGGRLVVGAGTNCPPASFPSTGNAGAKPGVSPLPIISLDSIDPDNGIIRASK
jgi:2-keto-3-deoxy-6-phosphogluconate aldolase